MENLTGTLNADADVSSEIANKNSASSNDGSHRRSKGENKSERQGPKSKASSKPAALPWTFPKNTLEEAVKIARAVEEQHAGNPMKPDMLAKAVGYNSTSDWRFLDLLRSANLYGLVDGRGKTTAVSLTDIGRDVVSPSSPSARPKALQMAFRNVPEFQKVEDFYQGKKLPEDEFFENTLYREFSIPRERIRAFIETFTSNLND